MSTDAILVKEITERECEIIALLAEGLTNREIATRIYIAENTVKWYIRQLNSKLYTHKRQEIVERAQELGLLDEDAPELDLPKHNLPYQATLFVGRDSELDELHEILSRDDIRLLTILAHGGMGKTRIALELAEQQLGNFEYGVYFVPLQSLSDVMQIIVAIAQHIGFQFIQDHRSPEQQLLDYLSNKQMLLVLDNFEHLLEGASIVLDILQAAPDVVILVTSREKLSLSSESIFRLKGMAHPDWETPEDALKYDAVQLLVQTARRVKPDWELITDNLDYVARICRLTEGMPLGILLAMSWLDVLSLVEIATEIQKNVDFLDTEMRDIPKRHRSIHAIFDATWQRLKTKERDVFMKLSVFRDGFTREAAESVAEASIIILQGLMNKALLLRDKNGRYDLHELLRQYAEKELHKHDGESAVREAHFVYYSTQLIDLYPSLYDRRQVEAATSIEQDYDNIRTAWDYALTKEYIEAIRDMSYSFEGFFNIRFSQEWKDIIAEAYQTFKKDYAEHPSFSNLLRIYTLYHIHENAEQVAMLECALGLAREHHRKQDMAHCLTPLSGMYHKLERYEEAWQNMDEAKHIFQEIGDIPHVARTLLNKGLLSTREHNIEAAKHYYEEALALFRQLGYLSGISAIINNLGVLALKRGDLDTYIKLIEEALAIDHLLSNKNAIDNRSWMLGIGEWLKGDLVAAHQSFNMSLKLSNELNKINGIINILTYDALLLWFDGQKELAQKHILEAQSHDTKRPEDKSAQSLIQFYQSYFNEDYEAAKADWLSEFLRLNPHIPFDSYIQILLPFTLVLSHTGDAELSIILLAAIDNVNLLPKWFDKTEEFKTWLARVKTQLSQQEFDAAWEYGTSMDETMVNQRLRDSFVDEQ